MPSQFWESLANAPAATADGTALASAATATISPAPDFTYQPGYWYPGKVIRAYAFGRFTTTATQGTLTLNLQAGLLATPVTVLTSGAYIWTASLTNAVWQLDAYVICRAAGTSGSLFAAGRMAFATAVTSPPATAGQLADALLPPSAPAATTVDTTVAGLVRLQATESVASQSIQVHQWLIEDMD